MSTLFLYIVSFLRLGIFILVWGGCCHYQSSCCSSGRSSYVCCRPEEANWRKHYGTFFYHKVMLCNSVSFIKCGRRSLGSGNVYLFTSAQIYVLYIIWLIKLRSTDFNKNFLHFCAFNVLTFVFDLF